MKPMKLETHPGTPVAADVISYATGECSLGIALVARSTSGVCAILLGDDRAALGTDLESRFPQAVLVENMAAVRDDLASVSRFASNPHAGLNLSLDMRGTPYQRRVWERLRTIPAGRTVTYSELARWISPFASPRAIAQACAANPLALAVPCHRVVRADGDLAGFRWGLDRKRELLRLEARP